MKRAARHSPTWNRPRFQESEKWMAYYEAQHMLERVKLDLLHQTGTLTAALQ